MRLTEYQKGIIAKYSAKTGLKTNTILRVIITQAINGTLQKSNGDNFFKD
jgi:hypothetical protein